MYIIINSMSKENTAPNLTKENTAPNLTKGNSVSKLDILKTITEEPTELKVCCQDCRKFSCGIVCCFTSVWSCCLNSVEACLHGCSLTCLCMSSGALLCAATLETIDCDKNPGACCC
jgi:hypothetical protein